MMIRNLAPPTICSKRRLCSVALAQKCVDLRPHNIFPHSSFTGVCECENNETGYSIV